MLQNNFYGNNIETNHNLMRSPQTLSCSSFYQKNDKTFTKYSNSSSIQRQQYISRLYSSTSFSTVSTNSLNNNKNWPNDPVAWKHFCSVLTSLYALFIIVFAVVVELSQKFTPDEWFSEMLFYTYMYGAGIVFLLYCYLFKVYPSWFNTLLKLAHEKQWIKAISNRYIVKTSHTNEGAGSLYLRLGTLCFGSSGIVLFCLEIFMCFSDQNCYNYQLINWIFAGLFTFIQMHFIFCNSKIIIVKSKNLTKLGTMHLLAVNIWTWLRFVLAKNAALERPQQLLPEPFLKFLNNTLKNNSTNLKINEKQLLINATFPNFEKLKNINFMRFNDVKNVKIENFSIPLKVSSFNYFGDFATLLTTSIVEYSVIGAAIMIVLWRSIDENFERDLFCVSKENENFSIEKFQKRRHKVRIDCSASSGGLFAGLLFMICAFVSIGIHSFFSQQCDSHGALLVFRLSDMALFCFTLIGCSIAIYRMRILQYYQQRSSSAELLDEILLVIGLTGELIYSSTGVMCWISTQADESPMEFYMLFVFITRIIQVVVQAIFILLSRRLRALSKKSISAKPGKQFVTFLLIANVSLFFFHTLEGMKSIFGENVNLSRNIRPYASLITGVAPLIVLYRFHSSVCLAEIWKHCYNVKKSHVINKKLAIKNHFKQQYNV